jgi:hypothetical protein
LPLLNYLIYLLKITGGKIVMKVEKYLMPFGMIGAVVYFLHTTLGRILWKEYNPITTDISSLTADGAPNAELLRVFTFIYGICSLLFVLGMVIKAFRRYNGLLKLGFIIMFIMQFTSVIGYSSFPLTGDKNVMNVQNRMHIIITVIVVFTTIASTFLLALGYRKEEGMNKLGNITLIAAILITIFGSLNPITMSMKLNVLGLTERLVIYTLQIFIFILSYLNTFTYKTTL